MIRRQSGLPGNASAAPQGAAAKPARLLQRAVALLARRDYGRIELQRRLQRLLDPGEDSEHVQRALDQLQASGLLSDERFAAGLTRQRAARFGAARVGHDLRQRGLPEDLIRATLGPLAGTELSRARAVWQRRFGAAPQSRAEFARQARFLTGRGFSGDVIRQVIAGHRSLAGDDAVHDDASDSSP